MTPIFVAAAVLAATAVAIGALRRAELVRRQHVAGRLAQIDATADSARVTQRLRVEGLR